jgi:RNA polymerase sigma-70 factor (ECF subfamily)
MADPLDRSKVDRLVVEHLPTALRFAMRLTGDPHLAEDVVQESLCRVLRQWRGYRGDASFGTWMLKIVVNVDRDRRRRRRRDADPISADELVSGAPPPIEQLGAGELHDQIRQAVDRLPPRQREVALLSFGEELPARDIAHILEISEANVHTCLHLARKRIARTIGVDYVRPE